MNAMMQMTTTRAAVLSNVVAAAPRTIRLSLRELSELPYRAFRVAGAGHGGALSAAEAVQFAELHSGTGLAAGVSACANAWAGGLATSREDTPGGTTFPVISPEPLIALQVGAALVDLASCTGGPGAVRFTAAALDATLDLPLLLAAERTGRAAIAARRETSGTAIAIRLATPEGGLGEAVLTGFRPGAGAGRGASFVGALLENLGGAEAALIVADPEASDGLLPQTALRSRAELAAHRARAARDGVHVDAAVWAEVLRIATSYKQFDKEKNR